MNTKLEDAKKELCAKALEFGLTAIDYATLVMADEAPRVPPESPRELTRKTQTIDTV